jgi:hypothetical protein
MRYLLLAFVLLSPLAFAQGNYVYDTTSVNTNASTNNNNNVSTTTNNNNSVSVSTNTNNNNNISTSTNINNNTSVSTSINTNNSISESTSTNTNKSISDSNVNSVSTINSTSSSVNKTDSVNINTNNSLSNSISDNTNKNINNSTSVSAETITQNNQSISQATQDVDQTIHSPPPSAIAPSLMSYSQDVCMSGASGAIQTQVLGMSIGKQVRDENCERIKLSKTLYDMGMRVASVSLLCQDERVWNSMMMAGTPCPYEGMIGDDAKNAWNEHQEKIPGAKNH